MSLFSSAIRYALVLAMGLGLLYVGEASARAGVARLVEGELPAGWRRARFDAGNLSSGVYLYRVQAGDFQDTGRMLLLK